MLAILCQMGPPYQRRGIEPYGMDGAPNYGYYSVFGLNKHVNGEQAPGIPLPRFSGRPRLQRPTLVRLALLWLAVAPWALAEGPLGVRPKTRLSTEVDGSADTGPSMLRANVNWIRVPVHVVDESGAPYAGLARADFQLLEDGVPQEVRHLAIEEAPASITIVFDASSSMKDKLGDSREALRRLFDYALPGDEYSLIEFGNEPGVAAPFTQEPVDIEHAAARIRLSTWTALYDALYLGVAQARHGVNARKAIVLLSDGADNNSRYSEGELRRYVQESDVAIYSVAIRSSARHAAMLHRLAEATGGLSIEARDLNALGPAVARISRALRSHYVLDYISNQTGRVLDGLYRHVDLKLIAHPDLRLNWRHGYCEPASY
jgi:Ca-activated chloride channel homolog